MADIDWGNVEEQLKEKSGQWYDPTMLEDVQRNQSYNGGSDVNDWINRVSAKSQLRANNEPNSTYVANGRGGVLRDAEGNLDYSQVPQSGSAPAQAAPSSQPDTATAGLIQQMMERQAAQDAANKARGDALYGRLNTRMDQSLAVDRNDPIIRAQADAYAANEERSKRNYLADLAEKAGPLANIQGETRLANERTGQATGAFEAQLMGQELKARREEIAQALAQSGAMLSADQVNELQRQLALLDNAIKQQQVGLGQQQIGLDQQRIGLGRDTLAQEWQRALLQNEQFNNQLGQTGQQQSAYYDWLWGHGA